MKELYGKGLATHAGPESCGAARECSAEALTGVRAGRVLSRARNAACPDYGQATARNSRSGSSRNDSKP